MLGSAAFRTGVTPGGALAGPWVRNPLWTRARAVPSLDLRFADNKSLVDATTGASLVTFTRASSATYVGSDGLIKSAATDEARFDHNPTTGESLGLLVEEARTNLLLRSEEFDNASWGKTNMTVTANAIVSPNGAITADAIFETAATGEHFVRQTITGLTANTNFTTSIFVKNLDSRNLQIRILDLNLVTNGYIGIFSPNTGTVISSSSVGFGVLTSASIVPYSNGWYRAILTGNAGVTCTAYIVDFYSLSGTTSVFAGDITKGLYLWGGQLE